MICSIGVPVNLELESVTIGYALKSSFYLPSNTSVFWSFAEPFNVSTSPNFIVGRSEHEIENGASKYDDEQQERFERSQSEANVIENGTIRNNMVNSNIGNNFGTTRWLVYKGLARVADK